VDLFFDGNHKNYISNRVIKVLKRQNFEKL